MRWNWLRVFHLQFPSIMQKNFLLKQQKMGVEQSNGRRGGTFRVNDVENSCLTDVQKSSELFQNLSRVIWPVKICLLNHTFWPWSPIKEANSDFQSSCICSFLGTSASQWLRSILELLKSSVCVIIYLPTWPMGFSFFGWFKIRRRIKLASGGSLIMSSLDVNKLVHLSSDKMFLQFYFDLRNVIKDHRKLQATLILGPETL